MERRYTERVELHCHTNKSESYGVSSPLSIIKFAQQQKMSAVAFSDYGNLLAYPEIQHDTSKWYAEIKPIYGIELLVADNLLPKESIRGKIFRDGYPVNYVLILIQNETGRNNLYHLLSEGNFQTADRMPWITWSRLLEMREGLLLGSGSSSGELQCTFVRKCDDAIIRRIAERFDFLEVQPVGNDEWCCRSRGEKQRLNREDLQELRRGIISLGEALDIPVVATSDSHYLREENRLSWQVLMHKYGRTTEMEDEMYFRTTDEMLQEFAGLGEEKAYEIVVHNTNKIAERIEKVRPVKQEKKVVRIESADDKLRELCEQGVLKRWGQKECVPEEVYCRLEKELEYIEKYGFAIPFLHYHELILRNQLKTWQYILKGKAAASLVCYLLGISHTNPLNPSNPLYNEFFAGCEGNIEPVIELAVDETVVDKVIQSMDDLPSVEKVVQMTHNYRVSDSDITKMIEYYAKTYGELPMDSMEQVKHDLESCLYRKGIPHANRFLVIPEGYDVQSYFPIGKDYTGSRTIAHFTCHDIDHLFPVYSIQRSEGCTLLTKLQERIHYFPSEQDIAEPDYLALIPLLKGAASSAENTDSEFNWTTEFEDDYSQKIIRDCRPVTLADYVKVKALSHGDGIWEDNGRELLKEGHVLRDLVATPEDVYEKLITYGMDSETAFQIADLVRKGRIFLKRTNAVEEIRQNQVPEWFVSSCEKARYLMPRAYAVEVTKLELRILYYKINYPKEFDKVYSEFSGMPYDYAKQMASVIKNQGAG